MKGFTGSRGLKELRDCKTLRGVEGPQLGRRKLSNFEGVYKGSKELRDFKTLKGFRRCKKISNFKMQASRSLETPREFRGPKKFRYLSGA